MNSRDRAASLMAVGALVGEMAGGPYSGLEFNLPKGKHRYGTVVRCHVCGASRVTLYKDGDQRICGKCRKEKEDTI